MGRRRPVWKLPGAWDWVGRYGILFRAGFGQAPGKLL